MEYVPIFFMLLFAVLAFGWFYVQRAKTRGTGGGSETPNAEDRADATERH